MNAIPYAIIDSDGRCVNRTLWDGETEWQPPAGCTAVPDPDGIYFIWQAPDPDPDPLAALTPEQRAALLALLQQDA